MKKSLYSLIVAAVVSFGSLCAQGAEATSQAIVLKIKGAPQAIVAGESQPVTLKVGDKLPQGATITTGVGAEVDLQAFNGAVATIKESSTVNLEKLSVTTSGGAVTKQTALLNLKVGTIISNIDPANHNINDYGIRTPKGVAAARGTVFEVAVTATGEVQVFVTNSVVLFTNAAGQSVRVEAGSQVTVSPDGTISAPTPTPSTGTPAGATEVGDKSTIPAFSNDAQVQSNSN